MDATCGTCFIGVRTLRHVYQDDKMDFYIGAKLGYDYWQENLIKNSANSPDFTMIGTGNIGDVFVPGLFLGYKVYIDPKIGFGFEIGAGGPYLIMGCLNWRW